MFRLYLFMVVLACSILSCQSPTTHNNPNPANPAKQELSTRAKFEPATPTISIPTVQANGKTKETILSNPEQSAFLPI